MTQSELQRGPAGFAALPAGACDCHMHVFGDPARYPGAPDRTYQPLEMPFERYLPVARRLGIERIVFVQPSAYGADNSAMMDAMRDRTDFTRGVAVMDERHDAAALDALDKAGVRGVRLNLMSPRITDPDAVQARFADVAGRISRLGWHIQIYADLDLVAAIAPAIRKAGLPVVIDHMGGAKKGMAVHDPRFETLLGLVADGVCWVKVSGADIVTWETTDFSGAADFAGALIAANTGRVVWGTDWPHLVHHSSGQGAEAPDAGYRPVDEAALVRHLVHWAGSAATLRRILVDNPAELYRF